MKYYFCNSELIWCCDYDFEDYGYDGQGIVTTLCCSNEKCGADFECFLRIDKDE